MNRSIKIRTNGKSEKLILNKKQLKNYIIKHTVVKHFKDITDDIFFKILYNLTNDSYRTTDFNKILRNSISNLKTEGPNCINYWIHRGYSKEQSLEKQTINQKNAVSYLTEENINSRIKGLNKYLKNSSNKTLRENSHRCIEYWLKKGYSLDDSKIKVQNVCDTTSLKSFVERHGKENGIKKYSEFIKIQSEKSSGEKNGMFGKKPTYGSGNGWSGWYKGHYFRSLLELSYLYYLIEDNIDFISAENKKFMVEYYKNNIKRNYFPDFYIIKEDMVIEIKPSKLISYNKLKFDAAMKKFNNFKIITEKDINILNNNDIKKLYDSNQIKFIERYDKKYKERYLNET